MSNNPWEGMPPNNQRRIAEWSERDLFWMTDVVGSYGFYIHSSVPIQTDTSKISLKGITVAKRTSENGSDFFLVLSNKQDWPIFCSLCRDLIASAIHCGTEEEMIIAVESRLWRWQQLLKSGPTRPLSIEVQMGLFAELLCLRDIIAGRSGLPHAVLQWKGPDADVQDFLCDLSALEVKSYSSSRGPTALISSLQQLWSDKERLYLVAYGLSVSPSGITVGELANQLLDSLDSDINAKDLLEAKLGQYGYIPNVTPGELEKFVSDGVRGFEVRDDFPRIPPANVRPEITSVRYSIDLSRCSGFEIPLSSIQL